MNFRDLTYLVALADLKHFGKAAEACFVSQPSLSIQIKKLENHLGTTLVERTNKSVLITEAGKKVADAARVLLQQSYSLENIAKENQDPLSGELNLGIIPTLTTYLLPHLLPYLTLTESFPKLSIYIAELHANNIINQLKEGKLDVAILSLPVRGDDLEITPLFEEELMLAIPEKHSLGKKKSVKISDLQHAKMLLMDNIDNLHEQALTLCQQMNIEIAKQIRSDNLEVLKYMILSNLGVTLIPSLACLPISGISYLPFQSNQPKRTIAMVWRKTAVKKALYERLVAHIKRLLSNRRGIKISGT